MGGLVTERRVTKGATTRTSRPWLWCDWCQHARVRHVWNWRWGYCCRDCSCTNALTSRKADIWGLTDDASVDEKTTGEP